jgi:hypothetical protein
MPSNKDGGSDTLAAQQRWVKFATGLACGVVLAFVLQIFASTLWVSSNRAPASLHDTSSQQLRGLPADDFLDIAHSVDMPQCAVLPSPKQIVYNRIGKAGSMTVSQAIISAHGVNGFEWKNLPGGEFGTQQSFLELMQRCGIPNRACFLVLFLFALAVGFFRPTPASAPPCHALPCLALHCPALPCPAVPCASSPPS